MEYDSAGKLQFKMKLTETISELTTATKSKIKQMSDIFEKNPMKKVVAGKGNSKMHTTPILCMQKFPV